ncbi:MAG: hypothetical protein V1773_07440 [bacterium]
MDSKLTNAVCEIKLNLNKIDKCLDNMDGEDYIPNNEKITIFLSEIKAYYEKIKEEYPIEVVEKIKKEISEITKHIDKKFDSIIRIKNIELQELSKEIRAMENQKKIVNYR